MMSLTEIDDLITWPDKSADAEYPHRPGAQGSSPNAPNAPKTSNAPVARVAPVPGPGLRLTGVSKRFGDREVLKGIDLHIPPGEFVAIVGRSGCGKSTLLRLLAGLETLSGGTLQGGDVAATRFMFQDARLLPWARVAANVALGLPKEDAEPRAREALGQVGLADRANDWPARLSGGQRQRVALARALVRAPEFLLLDEPLGALDALTRIDMQRLIETIWLRHGFTALLVTHDVAEAVALADRVLLIEDGQVALDLRVDLPRPRVRDAAFAALEQRLLDRVLQNGQGGEAEEASPLSLPAPALRWAV